jgi:pilus assembly protein FimV
MATFFAAFGTSLLLMLVYYTARRAVRLFGYTKPSARGIDPVGEAEVFLAYGRVDEAIRALESTLSDEPDNLEVQVTLLRAYSRRHDATAYSSLAAKVSPRLQGKAVWTTIQKAGRELDPANPLYHQVSA